MVVALDVNKNRVHIDNTIARESYFCPCCGGELIRKMGEERQHHFAHRQNTECSDSWAGSYDMSEWHQQWQSCYPVCNQEIQLNLGKVRHRADVLTGKTIVEFQHSHITMTNFSNRNYFYTSLGYKVVWLFDLREEYSSGKLKRADGSSAGFVWSRPLSALKNFDLRTGQADIFFQLSDDDDSIIRVANESPSFEHFTAAKWYSKEQFLIYTGCEPPCLQSIETDRDYISFCEKYNIHLDPDQERAVETINGAILLIAVPGSGKTTVTRLINGLIPHFYEGKMEGCAMVNGLNVTEAELYDTARIVGSVFQNPRSQFFCVDTTSELAFGCENMGMPEDEILSRVDEAARELNIEKLLGRSIYELSGGEKQKISCASVSALRPEVMVLDEPTSNLDVHAIEELKQTLLGWKAEGKTIVIAEHRLSWLRNLCDRVICMKDGQVAFDLSMQAFAQYSTEQLHQMGLRSLRDEKIAPVQNSVPETETMQLQNFCFSYDGTPVLNIPHLSLPLDGIIALVGPNGAGKSTFSRCLCGLEKKFKGQVKINGQLWKNRQLLKNCYMVMQDVNHQLFCETVADEVQLGMRSENSSDVERVLEMLDLSHLRERHPMSLSGGQKQRVAIASAILAGKEILIFDEPTSGLDFRHMEQTAALLSSLKGNQTVLIVTHDPELIQRCCDHIVCIENGTVI